MSNVVKLDVTEFSQKIAELPVGKSIDFAICCEHKDTQKANKDDLSYWLGAKRIDEFDQEMILIGEYGGGGFLGTLTDKWNGCKNETFLRELDMLLDDIAAFYPDFNGFYIAEEGDT